MSSMGDTLQTLLTALWAALLACGAIGLAVLVLTRRRLLGSVLTLLGLAMLGGYVAIQHPGEATSKIVLLIAFLITAASIITLPVLAIFSVRTIGLRALACAAAALSLALVISASILGYQLAHAKWCC